MDPWFACHLEMCKLPGFFSLGGVDSKTRTRGLRTSESWSVHKVEERLNPAPMHIEEMLERFLRGLKKTNISKLQCVDSEGSLRTGISDMFSNARCCSALLTSRSRRCLSASVRGRKLSPELLRSAGKGKKLVAPCKAMLPRSSVLSPRNLRLKEGSSSASRRICDDTS